MSLPKIWVKPTSPYCPVVGAAGVGVDAVAFVVMVLVFSLLDSVFCFESDLEVCLFLKSVTYQPVPFSWKPAAEIFLT